MLEQKKTLRKPETEAIYREFLSSPEAKVPFFWDRANIVKEFNFWRVCENDFPYDRIYQRHCILAPVRKVQYHGDLTIEETNELQEIKESDFVQQFDQVLENLGYTQTIPDHIHYHLGRLYRE